MVGDRINKSMKGESHLSFSIMLMIGQISSTTVTPVNHSVEGKALMQEIREGTQGLLGAEQFNRRSPESIMEELMKSKVIPFNSLWEEGRGTCFSGRGAGVSRESVTVGEKWLRSRSGEGRTAASWPQIQRRWAIWTCRNSWRTCRV